MCLTCVKSIRLRLGAPTNATSLMPYYNSGMWNLSITNKLHLNNTHTHIYIYLSIYTEEYIAIYTVTAHASNYTAVWILGHVAQPYLKAFNIIRWGPYNNPEETIR